MIVNESSPPVNVNPNVWYERLRRAGVPEHLHDGLVDYLVGHLRPGSVLRAVLENDLLASVSRADETSAAAIVPIVRFLCNYAPIIAWGSPAHVQAWPVYVSGWDHHSGKSSARAGMARRRPRGGDGMKKITSTDHVVRIFTEESVDICRVLLDVTQGILRSRTPLLVDPVKQRRRRKTPTVPPEGGPS